MIDVRGQGGYVVAAGSRLHPRPDRDDGSAETDESAYRLLRDVHPAELPGWLIAVRTGNRRDDQESARPSPERTRNQSMSSPSASYGAAALRGESDRVRWAPVGQRNHTLNSAAYSLGQLVAAGALDQARAVQALIDAAGDAGLEAAEIAATIESGFSAGLKQPRSLRDPHIALDAAIEQARAAVAELEATRVGAGQQSVTGASDVAVHNGRPAYWPNFKVAP
jgi:hypothetical protein